MDAHKSVRTHLVRRRIQRALVIVAQLLQRALHGFAHLLQRRQRAGQLALLPVHAVQWLDAGRHHVRPLRLLERMTAEDLLADQRRRFVQLLDEVEQRVSVDAVQPEHVLVAGHGDLFDVLAELDARQPVDFDHFVDAAECGLSLTGDCNVLLRIEKMVRELLRWNVDKSI